ncbi:hypothetical protein BG011_005133 [Mortierella polycephala]|uniref:TEA domain-containing protein n=1 Tax=Mortierella polycephala TaxID=41804 RepID=A0A9P6QGX0_9FUNG|nr:hypothetical protein BG011_005133 [Mortierella polycephala]
MQMPDQLATINSLSISSEHHLPKKQPPQQQCQQQQQQQSLNSPESEQQQEHQQVKQEQLEVPQPRACPSSAPVIGPQRTQSILKRRLTKEKLSRNDREEVWPSDVEKVFYDALEVIPKLGRRKVLVDGKPCGRNELIADYIYKRTNKIRTRKQVSSHIQVLKNTRKSDVAFMKLLMDSSDGDEDLTIDIPAGYYSVCESPMGSPTSPASPTGLIQMDQWRNSTTAIPSFEAQPSQIQPLSQVSQTTTRQPTKRHRHTQSMSSIIPDTLSSLFQTHPSCSPVAHSVYRQCGSTPDSAVSLSAEMNWKNSPSAFASGSDGGSSDTTAFEINHGLLNNGEDSIMGDALADISYPFWPSVFGMYTEYIPDLTPGAPQIHSLARSRDLGQQSFGSINVHQLAQEKFPTLYDLYQKTMCTFLFFKIKLDLNLGLNGVFGNTSLFESTERRWVECTTSIYSFGIKVLEAKELKQAAAVNNKFVCNFEFVNQFFGAFLNGIRSLATWDEIDIALKNLSVIQVFEDKDTRFESPAPLLVMAFDFERGQGDIETFFIADGSDMLESLVC